MAIPFPLAEETEQEFLDRCMSDGIMRDEFKDINSRLQVCSIQTRYRGEKAREGFSRHRISFRDQGTYQVDQSNGVMTEVSLIQVGEATGHDLFVDEKSLETALNVIGNSIPAYITHEGALSSDRILKEVGVFSEFYIDGDKLKAKSFKALDSFREDEKQKFNRLFDIANSMPETFGVSLVFEAMIVYILKSGAEIPANELTEEDQVNIVRESPSVRFISIKSADFVDAPASNEQGLFSKLSKLMDAETKKTDEVVEEKLEEATEVAEQSETNEQPSLESKIDELEKRLSESDKRITELQGKLSESEKVNETLSSLIEGEEPISEEVTDENLESVSISEQFANADGIEATELFRKHRSEIRSSFNKTNRG